MKSYLLAILCLWQVCDNLCSLDWWKTATFYQIYPRSFKDSNGDGIGDLNGITERLPYLKDLGIQAIWLSPIFKSPMKDFGYDIQDFYNIQPEYGTIEDFERLLRVAHDLKLKILLDFVPNHSSHLNEWFIKSAKRLDGYDDFYVWHPGREDPQNPNKKLPPSNWRSVFRGSAWTYHEGRGEYYLHQFAVHQPDLNYRNPEVIETMKGVMKFWLNKEVDGFRVDAVPNLFEILPTDGNYPDEPLSHLTDDENSFDYLDHIYTMDQPETIDMVYQWREVMDEYTMRDGNMRTMLSEADSEISILMSYYGDGVRNGSHVPFNFKLLMNLNNDSNAIDFRDKIHIWLDNLPEGCVANWVIGNHDRARVGSRFGTDRIDLINMIISTLPGISITYYVSNSARDFDQFQQFLTKVTFIMSEFTTRLLSHLFPSLFTTIFLLTACAPLRGKFPYKLNLNLNFKGEEIGMTDVFVSWDESVDPAACGSDPEHYLEFSRDPARTPFQWDNSKNAGFSAGVKTWLPVSPAYKEVNVKEQRTAERSHLKIYRQLMKLRTTLTLQKGSVETRTHGRNVLTLTRRYPGQDTYITVANIGPNEEAINLSQLFPGRLVYHIVSLTSKKREGEDVKSIILQLDPHEGLILRGKNYP